MPNRLDVLKRDMNDQPGPARGARPWSQAVGGGRSACPGPLGAESRKRSWSLVVALEPEGLQARSAAASDPMAGLGAEIEERDAVPVDLRTAWTAPTDPSPGTAPPAMATDKSKAVAITAAMAGRAGGSERDWGEDSITENPIGRRGPWPTGTSNHFCKPT